MTARNDIMNRHFAEAYGRMPVSAIKEALNSGREETVEREDREEFVPEDVVGHRSFHGKFGIVVGPRRSLPNWTFVDRNLADGSEGNKGYPTKNLFKPQPNELKDGGKVVCLYKDDPNFYGKTGTITKIFLDEEGITEDWAEMTLDGKDSHIRCPARYFHMYKVVVEDWKEDARAKVDMGMSVNISHSDVKKAIDAWKSVNTMSLDTETNLEAIAGVSPPTSDELLADMRDVAVDEGFITKEEVEQRLRGVISTVPKEEENWALGHIAKDVQATFPTREEQQAKLLIQMQRDSLGIYPEGGQTLSMDMENVDVEIKKIFCTEAPGDYEPPAAISFGGVIPRCTEGMSYQALSAKKLQQDCERAIRAFTGPAKELSRGMKILGEAMEKVSNATGFTKESLMHAAEKFVVEDRSNNRTEKCSHHGHLNFSTVTGLVRCAKCDAQFIDAMFREVPNPREEERWGSYVHAQGIYPVPDTKALEVDSRRPTARSIALDIHREARNTKHPGCQEYSRGAIVERQTRIATEHPPGTLQCLIIYKEGITKYTQPVILEPATDKDRMYTMPSDNKVGFGAF